IEEVERLADHVGVLDSGRLRLSERAENLQARFRRVEVTGAPESLAATPDQIVWERAGSLTRFVETKYAGETTERAWRERFGAGATVAAFPMSLREIFLALARANRVAAREASA